MHNLPATIALFEHGSTQSAAIDMTRLSVVSYIRRDCIFERGPSRLARYMNLDISEAVPGVLHLTHLGHEMVIALIGPSVVCVPALKDRQRFIIVSARAQGYSSAPFRRS
jgi:hypothetical protein